MNPDQLHILRIFTDVKATHEGQSYAKALIDRARAMGVANAAILNVVDCYGSAGVVHGASAIDLAPGQHVIVELVDQKACLSLFLETLGQGEEVGLVTLETISIVGYGGHRHRAAT